MRKTNRSFTVISMLLLLSLLLTTSSVASETSGSQVLEFDDGSYVVVSVEYDQPMNGDTFFANRSVTSGTKHYDYYNGSDELVMIFRVHGSFVYNGVTASATSASYSYDLYDSGWTFIDGSASYSGATATATGTFRRLLFPNTVTVSLTCSPTGVLS